MLTREIVEVRMTGDVVGERTEDYRKVREFLYVDLQRVRSYYAQLNRGVIESVLSREETSCQVEAQARIFGIGASGGGAQEWEREESRSLQDLNYVIFEELFEKAGYIEDVKEIVEDAASWGNGGIHASLVEGTIIRYTGLIQILDPRFVKARIDQLSRLMKGIAGAQIGAVPAVAATPPVRKGGGTRPGARAVTSDEARERLKTEILSTYLSGSALGQFEDIAAAVSAFTNDQISVRVLPCGRDYPDYHFAGT